MQGETYHVRSRGQVTGPFTRGQLAARAAAGQLTGVHMVSADGQRTWSLARNLEWLFAPERWDAPPDAPTIVRPLPRPAGDGRPAVPATGVPATGVPATGIPRTGIPATGIPATGVPATGVPVTGVPATGVPVTVVPPTGYTPGPPPVVDAGPRPAPPSPTARAVFVSHSSADAGPAMEIVEALERAGIPCWVAPRDIPPGANYSDQIMAGIEQCPVMLLLFSRNVVNSDPVQREVERGRSRRATVLPVRLDQSPLAGGLEFLVAMSQWVDAYPPPLARHLGKVTTAVGLALGMARAALAEMATAAAADPQQQYVGPYRLIEMIDEGGMGSVYKAEQLAPVQRTVAVKLIKPGVDSAQVVARFESERQALARMSHPNIARVLDAGTDQSGRPYFVMEYVPGVPITKFADANKLPVRDRLELFVQTCDAIAHAHAKSILHRDVKAGNVLAYVADRRPTVKVIDFGIALNMSGERMTDRPTHTRLGGVVGTLEYMSPEQAEGSPDIDTRSDVYSLGVLLYELLAGARPFDPHALAAMSELEARRVLVEADPPPPATRLTTLGPPAAAAVAAARQTRVDALAKDLRGELGWIPLMAMRKERQRRYASPLLLAEDVRNYLEDRPLMAGPESRAYKFRKFAARNRAGLAAAAVVAATLVGGVGTYVWWINDLRAQAVRQELRAVRQEQIARSVNRILYDVLSAADPKKGDGTDVLDAMNKAVQGMADRGAAAGGAHPEVRALVLDTVGNVQRSLGKYEEAKRQLGRGLELRRQSLPPDDPDIGRSLDHLAHLYKNLHKETKKKDPDQARRYYGDSLAMYDEALAIFRRSLPQDDLDVAATLANRALLLESAGEKLDEAEANAREALRVRRALAAPTSDLLQSLGSLSDILVKRGAGRLPEAERVIGEALGIMSALNPNDPDRARLLLQQGRLLKELNRLAEAEVAFREALRIDLVVFPPGHRYIDDARKQLNDVLVANNRAKDVLTADAVERMQAALKQGGTTVR